MIYVALTIIDDEEITSEEVELKDWSLASVMEYLDFSPDGTAQIDNHYGQSSSSDNHFQFLRLTSSCGGTVWIFTHKAH